MAIREDLMGVGIPAQAANLIAPDVRTGLTAAGTEIGDALALTARINVITTAAASTGVKLPDVPVGVTVIVQNNGASTMNIFPHSSSGTINGGSAGAAVTVAAAAGNFLTRISSTDWLASVFAKES